MYTPSLPKWVATFCCTMPFVALLVCSASALFGGAVSDSGMFALVILCGRVIFRLVFPTAMPVIRHIEIGE